MLSVTLHESDRHQDLEDLPEPRASQLRAVHEAYPDKAREELPIHYVPDDRDLSNVKPIEIPKYHILDRDQLKPLLDALEKGDIELAAALTPADKRLLGYVVVKEPYDHSCWGSYAADTWTVHVDAGIYPLFAREFEYHEAKHAFTNEIKMFQGFSTWLDGVIVQSSLSPGCIGERDTVWPQMYAYDLAESVLEPGNSNKEYHLVHPFRAFAYQSEYNGKPFTVHKVCDGSLPYLLPAGVNPIKLRNGGADLNAALPRLDDRITQAQDQAFRRSGQAESKQRDTGRV